MLIGITGGIGSGKSTLAAELHRRGYPVYDTDQAAKHIIVHNPAVRSQVEVLFGSDVFDGDTYRTDVVAKAVFHNHDLLMRLNAVVHPAVAFDLKHWYNIQKSTLCFVESAILYNSGLHALCDKIIEVTAPEDVRIARVMARDGAGRETVLARINAQNQDTHPAADMVINNDGTASVPSLVDSIENFL